MNIGPIWIVPLHDPSPNYICKDSFSLQVALQVPGSKTWYLWVAVIQPTSQPQVVRMTSLWDGQGVFHRRGKT